MASRRPTWKLRESGEKHVAIKSPMPDRPLKVAGLAPRCTPRRDISARPRVSKSALVLSPKPRPLARPAAIA
ncbi:hypothetical protein D3C87_1961200 [compost metagenome]